MARMYWHVDVDALEQAYTSGVSIEDLCDQFRITQDKLFELRKTYGIAARPRATQLDDAPSEDEERRSAASLALSPWVESRIKELREAKVLAEQEAEWQVTQVRMYRHQCSRV